MNASHTPFSIQRSGLRHIVMAALVVLWGSGAFAADVYSPRSPVEVRDEVVRWLARRNVKDAAIKSRVDQQWSSAASLGGRETFELLIETFCSVDPATRTFVESCRRFAGAPPRVDALVKDDSDPFYSDHLRLFCARYLTQRLMYDEALTVFNRVDPAKVVDPATCLFYRAVCQHQLLMKKEAAESLDALLHKTQGVAQSYSQVAALMQGEIEGLDDASLATVSRKMSDSERRLGLGRGGQRVQKVQDEIVESLDEIIKKKEQQMQQQMQQQAEGEGQTNRPNAPAQDSRTGGSTGPGNVDKKNLKKQGQWGGLPPKKEAEAKDLLSKEFPSNYRQAVEEYFKKLAGRNSK